MHVSYVLQKSKKKKKKEWNLVVVRTAAGALAFAGLTINVLTPLAHLQTHAVHCIVICVLRLGIQTWHIIRHNSLHYDFSMNALKRWLGSFQFSSIDLI